MSRALRGAGAALAIPLALFLAACSSSARSDEPTPTETHVEVDPVQACRMLIAVPRGLAQQKAEEYGCVETADGWEYQDIAPAPVAEPAAPEHPLSPAQPGGGISWDAAPNHVGSTQRVCGPLVGNGWHAEDAFLNLGYDYPDPRRFQIVVWDVYDLEPIAYGSTLCTAGPITSYNGVAQIELWDPALIEIYS